MSDPQDNIHNRKLKELLDKSKSAGNSSSGGEHDDAFEREALEGFATLESEKEIFDLKAKLDKRIYSEVFTEEKKSRKTYWYAAAGLLLVIGFSVYFIQNNLVSPPQDLAIVQPSDEGDEIKKSIEAATEKNQSMEFKSAEPQKEEPKGSINNHQQPQKNRAEKDNEPDFKEAEEQKLSDQGPAIAASPPADYSAAPALEKKPEAKTTKFVEPEISADDKSNKALDADIAVSNSTEELSAIRTESKAKQRSKESKKEMTPQSAAPSVGGVSAQIAGPAKPFYKNGPDALANDLREKLVKKNLLQNFDALLYINAKGKVEKVVYTTSPPLEKSEIDELTSILKSLKFENVAGEYKLVFKP